MTEGVDVAILGGGNAGYACALRAAQLGLNVILVERDKADIFDHKVQEIAQRYEGKLAFRYTGPWPPYNFVTIRLQLERSAVV